MTNREKTLVAIIDELISNLFDCYSEIRDIYDYNQTIKLVNDLFHEEVITPCTYDEEEMKEFEKELDGRFNESNI